MNYVCIGEIVNTHGIKGELRIVSDIEYKDCIFQKGTHLYIGKNKSKEIIATYRYHKIYDMVTLEGLQDINDVLGYKGEKVYINRDEFSFPSFLKEDLIGLDVLSNGYQGKVTSILKSKAHDILVIEKENQKHLVPYIDEFIQNIDFENKKIEITDMKGLFDEN